MTWLLVVVLVVWAALAVLIGLLFGAAVTERDRHEIRNDDRTGGRVMAAALALVLLAAIALTVTGPEPCTDGTSTVCAEVAP